MHGMSSQIEEAAACERQQRVQSLRAQVRCEDRLKTCAADGRHLRECAPGQSGSPRAERCPRDDAQRQSLGNLVDGYSSNEGETESGALARCGAPSVQGAVKRGRRQQRGGEPVQPGRAVIVLMGWGTGWAHRVDKPVDRGQ